MSLLNGLVIVYFLVMLTFMVLVIRSLIQAGARKAQGESWAGDELPRPERIYGRYLD